MKSPVSTRDIFFPIKLPFDMPKKKRNPCEARLTQLERGGVGCVETEGKVEGGNAPRNSGHL